MGPFYLLENLHVLCSASSRSKPLDTYLLQGIDDQCNTSDMYSKVSMTSNVSLKIKTLSIWAGEVQDMWTAQMIQ